MGVVVSVSGVAVGVAVGVVVVGGVDVWGVVGTGSGRVVLEWVMGMAVEGGAGVLGLALPSAPVVGAVGLRPVCAVLGPVVPSGGRGGSVRCVSWLMGVSGVHRCVEDAVESRASFHSLPLVPCFGVAHAFHISLHTCGSSVPAGCPAAFWMTLVPLPAPCPGIVCGPLLHPECLQWVLGSLPSSPTLRVGSSAPASGRCFLFPPALRGMGSWWPCPRAGACAWLRGLLEPLHPEACGSLSEGGHGGRLLGSGGLGDV